MTGTSARTLAVAALLAAVPLAAVAHPSGLAGDGCHRDSATGTRHCHGDGAVTDTACAAPTGTWRGITVAPECRCMPYERSDYRYPQSVERRIADRLGGMWSPYDGTRFGSLRESDIEHVVALSEAHDSGLCAATAAVRRRFARDLDNLTLATPSVNRRQKGGRDAAEWLPERNRCWFAAVIVTVRQQYRLTIDRREAAALDAVLAACD